MSDLINRQDAIEYFMTNTNWHDEEGYPIEDAKDKRALLTDYFNGIPSAQQWIPCSERLPDEEQDVLITDGTLIWVGTLIKADCGYMWEDDYGYWHPMSEWKAWMPLPEPYKEKS